MSILRAIVLLIVPLSWFTTTETGVAAERFHIAGPVEADVVSVVDGDTLMVNARPWPQQSVSVLVRIRGIDTPELRAKCAEQRELAEEARQVLAQALRGGDGRLILSDISGDKYFGRVVANVTLPDARDAASLLLASGLARPYEGGRKTAPPCD